MKKLLSIVLAVAVLSTMAFSMIGASVSAAEKVSLLPASADKFVCKDGGDGSVTVAAEGTGYKFTATGGWPTATYINPDEASWAKCMVNDAECYLNYDFEVKTGGTNIIVYFGGQNPDEQGAAGSGETLNYIIDAANNNLASGNVQDLKPGKYSGSIPVKQLGCAENLILSEEGDAAAADAYFTISAVRIFAVGGEVIVNELSVGPKTGEVVTTAAQSDATTTTVAKTTAKAGTDSAKTGDTTNAIVFIAVAAVAAGAVVVTAKKQKAR